MNQRQNKKDEKKRKSVGINWGDGELGETKFIKILVALSHIFMIFVHFTLCKINLRNLIEWSLTDKCAKVINGELCWYPSKTNEQIDGKSRWINTQQSKALSCWRCMVNMWGIGWNAFILCIIFGNFHNKNIWGRGQEITKLKQHALLLQGRYF